MIKCYFRIKTLGFLIGLSVMLWLAHACHKHKVVEPQPPQTQAEEPEPEVVTQVIDSNVTVLGAKLKNPYAISNMRKAFERVETDSINGMDDVPAISMPISHLYLKFIPKTQEELDILLADSNLVLYEYPLDYEIENLGDYYRDSTIPDDQPTPQYCAVEADYTLPTGVDFEILDFLFIPEEVYADEWNDDNLTPMDTLIDRMVGHALILTGNAPSDTSAENRTKKICFWNCFPKWRPKGRIRVWDNSVTSITERRWVQTGTESYRYCYEESSGGGSPPMRTVCVIRTRPTYGWREFKVDVDGAWVGVEGVEVRARRWFTTHKGYTDAYGNYSCSGRFERSANYSIRWERYHFSIRADVWGQAIYHGPKKTGDWNLDIASGASRLYATVFRAAHHYYYKDILGLKRPPRNSFSTPQTKITVHNKNNTDASGDHRTGVLITSFTVLPQIRIWNNGQTNQQIYATTIHELAHASHYELTWSFWHSVLTAKVAESWARGVQWALTRMVYPDYRGGGFRPPNYTEIVIDMIDAPSTTDHNTGSEKLAEDNVSGYTIKQIEDVLYKTGTWFYWHKHMFEDYPSNPTRDSLDVLFNYWNTRR